MTESFSSLFKRVQRFEQEVIDHGHWAVVILHRISGYEYEVGLVFSTTVNERYPLSYVAVTSSYD